MHLRESLVTRINLLLVGFESFRYVALPASFLCKLILALHVLRRLYCLYVVSTCHSSTRVKLILRDVISANITYYARIMLDAFVYLLCSKQCWHNLRTPTGMSATVHMYMCLLITCQSHVSLSKLVVITENTTITENPYDGQVRLVGGDDGVKSAGRLEIYLNNIWRAVCSEGFTDSEADSVCRQLGYTKATSFPSVPR